MVHFQLTTFRSINCYPIFNQLFNISAKWQIDLIRCCSFATAPLCCMRNVHEQTLSSLFSMSTFCDFLVQLCQPMRCGPRMRIKTNKYSVIRNCPKILWRGSAYAEVALTTRYETFPTWTFTSLHTTTLITLLEWLGRQSNCMKTKSTLPKCSHHSGSMFYSSLQQDSSLVSALSSGGIQMF